MSGLTNPTDFYKTMTRSLITPNSLKRRSLVTAIKLNDAHISDLLLPEIIEMPDFDEPQSELARPSTHPHLTDYLGATIYDLNAFGSVTQLIDHQIKIGAQDASFLVTDLTAVVEQYD